MAGNIQNYIKINREMLIDELYEIMGLVPRGEEESEEARRKLVQLVNIVNNAPLAESQAQYPKPSLRKY